jgi:hypothetical protein
MRCAPGFHMPVVLLDHNNAASQVSGKVVCRHSIIGQHLCGVEVPQAVHGAWLAVSGVVQEI